MEAISSCSSLATSYRGFPHLFAQQDVSEFKEEAGFSPRGEQEASVFLAIVNPCDETAKEEG